MAEISDEQLNHLEDLSQLAFSNEAKQKMKNDLNQIVAFINEIENCNLTAEELSEKCTTINRLREDEPAISISQEEALQNAPNKSNGYYAVSKVVD